MNFNELDFVKIPKDIGAEMLDREYRTLHCYVIPHSSVGEWIANKYKSGFEVDLDLGEDFKWCDIDSVLAAMGVVSYSEHDGDPYLTGYGIELMKQGLVWLEPDWDDYLRKYYNI